MMRFVNFFSFTILFLLCFFLSASAKSTQTVSDYVVIKDVLIFGNKKTKSSIILRETGFEKGDTILIYDIPDKCLKAQKQIINTYLFTEVVVFFDSIASKINIFVKEDWYIIPIPQLSVADRNLNDWFLNKDFDRLNLGVKLRWRNFTGNNDELTTELSTGYTQHVSLFYTRPFMDKKKKWGFGLGVFLNANREIWALPVNDRVQFFSFQNDWMIWRRGLSAELSYRKGLFDKTVFKVTLSETEVAQEFVNAAVNPHFLIYPESKNMQTFFLSATHIIDKRDQRGYAFEGHFFKAYANYNVFTPMQKKSITNVGIGAQAAYFKPVTKHWHFNTAVLTEVNTLSKRPYEFSRALGYGNIFVRGYEYMVIDGRDFGLMRNNFKYAIQKNKKYYNTNLPRAFNNITSSLLMGVFADLGFVNSPFVYKENKLPNTLMASIGLGIDWVLFYDRVLRLEFTTNKQMQSGLYVHLYAPF